MRESSWGVLRPLLGIEKSEIYKFLEENNLQYFEDETNQTNDYTRNYIRNEILPKFAWVHPEHKKNLNNLFSYFEELKSHLDSQVFNFLWDESNSFSISELLKLSPLLQKEIIREVFYRTNNNSTIGLSEGNIAEVLRFIWGKNNKTKKEIQKMHLFKDGDIIQY